MRIVFATLAILALAADADAGCRGLFGRRHVNHNCASCQPYNAAPQQSCYQPQYVVPYQPVRNVLMAPVRIFTGSGCANGQCR